MVMVGTVLARAPVAGESYQ